MTRLLIAIFLGLTWVAQSAPAWDATLTASKVGPHPSIRPLQLQYELSWKGMLDAGKLQIEFAPRDAKKPGKLVVKSHAQSQGIAGGLFPYRHDFWSEILPTTLRPSFFKGVERDHKELTTTTVRHHAGGATSKEVTVLLSNKKTTQETRSFEHGSFYDLFSAMLFIRSQKLENGDKMRLLILPFDNPYLLDVEVKNHERHLGNPAIRLQVAMTKIDRKTQQLRNYKKLKRPATLWLSDDADRIPLELRAAVFIGDVRATLTSRKPL